MNLDAAGLEVDFFPHRDLADFHVTERERVDTHFPLTFKIYGVLF